MRIHNKKIVPLTNFQRSTHQITLLAGLHTLGNLFLRRYATFRESDNVY